MPSPEEFPHPRIVVTSPAMAGSSSPLAHDGYVRTTVIKMDTQQDIAYGVWNSTV